MNPLTVAYITNRKSPRVHWFLESLARELREQKAGFMGEVKLLIVTHYPDIPMPPMPKEIKDFRILEPAPNPYFGPHRLTKRDSFCPAVSRNTALCAADSQHIAYCDDLSVLTPGWLFAVRRSMTFGRVTFGAYKKVKNLVVEDGVIKSCEQFPQGIDNRLSQASHEPIKCAGQWLYGCSLVLPVDVLLSVGGFAVDLSGTMGFEDCLTGIVLENAGHQCWYDPTMLTLESEEAHYEERPFFRCDKGTSPDDKSHSALRTVRNGMKYFHNSMPEGGIQKVRTDFLAGKGWPWPKIPVQPRHDWHDGQALSEMG